MFGLPDNVAFFPLNECENPVYFISNTIKKITKSFKNQFSIRFWLNLVDSIIVCWYSCSTKLEKKSNHTTILCVSFQLG